MADPELTGSELVCVVADDAQVVQAAIGGGQRRGRLLDLRPDLPGRDLVLDRGSLVDEIGIEGAAPQTALQGPPARVARREAWRGGSAGGRGRWLWGWPPSGGGVVGCFPGPGGRRPGRRPPASRRAARA